MTEPSERPCVICGKAFAPRRQADKTCDMDCQIQHRRQLSRASMARRYQKRPVRPDSTCSGCGAGIPAPKSGPLRRWCTPCKANGEAARAAKRMAERRCYKCQTVVPGAERKAGKAVCDDCRVDKRVRDAAHEHRRRLRRYGLTQDQYDGLLVSQNGRCPGCGSTEPGAKSWAIDHNHMTGRVRGLLCDPCNGAIGMLQEDVPRIRALADYLEQHHAIDEDKDIV